MDRVKGWKLLSATGVAMALFALVPLGMGIVRPGAPNTFWSVVVWPRLPMLLTGLPVVAAALITGCLARPWRPERLAAVAGGIGGFLVLALPYIRNYRPASTPALLLDGLITTWVMALPLAVSCWTGANYWRLDSWREFWRGPSGAIVKGGPGSRPPPPSPLTPTLVVQRGINTAAHPGETSFSAAILLGTPHFEVVGPDRKRRSDSGAACLLATTPLARRACRKRDRCRVLSAAAVPHTDQLHYCPWAGLA